MHLYQAQSSPARPSRPSNASISASSSSTISNYPNFPLNKQQQLQQAQIRNKTLFQHCLKDVAVPRALQEGIQVSRVFANGKVTRMTMKLSDDKFTLFLNHGLDKNSNNKRWSLIRKNNSGNTNDLDRVIDVGAISEIQRGHSRRNFQLARYVEYNMMFINLFLWYLYVRVILDPHSITHLCIFPRVSQVANRFHQVINEQYQSRQLHYIIAKF